MSLTIPDAATELGISQATIKRWIQEGAPVARRGTKGRGKSTLLDLDAIEAWRRQEGVVDALTLLAAELPALTADGIYATFCELDCHDKARMAGPMAVAWFAGTDAMLKALQARGIAVPNLDPPPEKIDRMRGIFRDSCNVYPNVTTDWNDG